jgi:hypothetical protein
MMFRFKVPQHWRAKQFRYRLAVYKCENCGTVHRGPVIICRKCRSTRLRQSELPRAGRLLSYTVVRQAPVGFEENAPYIVGVVEFEDGTRLLTQLTDCDPEELRTGMEVEAVVRKIAQDGPSGLIIYGYKFRPRVP